MVHIPDVELESLFPGQGVPTLDLGPTGQTGADLMTPCLPGAVTVEIASQKGPGADQAHLAAHNGGELGQLVEAGAP